MKSKIFQKGLELRKALNGYERGYKTLLKNCYKCTMEVRRLTTLVFETFKILNDLDSTFMKNLIERREVLKRRKSNLEITNRNTFNPGDKSIRSLEPNICNGLPEEIKNENSYDKFKEYNGLDQNVRAGCVPTLKQIRK